MREFKAGTTQILGGVKTLDSLITDLKLSLNAPKQIIQDTQILKAHNLKTKHALNSRNLKPANKMLKLSLLAALALNLASAEVTQTQTAQGTEQSAVLEASVVSASGFKQLLKDAPATINVITQKDLQSKPYRDVAEAISDIPGVEIHANKDRTGANSITIRGLTGYTLVLVDGRRQGVSGDIGGPNPSNSTAAQNTFLPPLSSIERIEVIKGPMSTLYGSEALGGVINIITKKVSDTWSTALNFDTLIQENQDWGNEAGFGISARGPVIDKTLGAELRFRSSQRQQSHVEYKNAQGNIVSAGPDQNPTQASFYSLGTKINYLFDEQNTFTWDLDFSKNFYNNRCGEMGALTQPQTSTGGTTYDTCDYANTPGVALKNGRVKEPTITRFIGSFQHEGQYDGFNLTTGAQYNVLQDDSYDVIGALGRPRLGQNRAIKAQDFIVDTKAVVALGEANTLSVGADYRLETIRDKAASPSYFDAYILGLYAEDEFIALDNLFLTLGARYNKHEIFGDNLSPRAYIVFNATDELTFKGGVSTGFKAPSPNRLINGPYTYRGSAGTIAAFGNPNLKEESSINYELGVSFDNEFISTSLTGFYTDFKDKLSARVLGRSGDSMANGFTCNVTTCSQDTNLGRVAYKGFELGNSLRPVKDLNLDFSYTYLDSEIKEDSDASAIGKPMSGTLKHNIIGKASYTLGAFTPWVRGEYQIGRYSVYAYKLSDRTTRYYKDIFLASLGASYALNENWNLNFSVLNLFNKSFTDSWADTGMFGYQNRYRLIEEGRRYYLNISGIF